jgi:hypothetical protein
MNAQYQTRKEAYQYILKILSNLPASADDKNWIQYIPLEELRLIKEGIADPSPALIALLKDLVSGHVSRIEIDSHLVTPFEA